MAGSCRLDVTRCDDTVGYLVLPIDLVPDFLSVAGQLDDAIIVALVLRWNLRGSTPRCSTSSGRAACGPRAPQEGSAFAVELSGLASG